MQRSPSSAAACRLLGLVWMAVWAVVLHAVASPWEDLGGLVGERLRWLERFTLFAGIAVGYALGGGLRQARPPGSVFAYLRSVRLLIYPAGLLTALGLLALYSRGSADPAGVVFNGFLAYWAGVDAAHGAVPLLQGRFLEDGDEILGRTHPIPPR